MGNSFFDSGVFLGSAPVRPATGKDLGEFGSSSGSGAGYILGSGSQVIPGDAVLGNYWARSGGNLFPATIGDSVAIGQYISSYGAKLSVNGGIAALGYLLSDAIFITKDGGDNLIFTDVVSGSHTLTELLSTGGGDVVVSGTPVNLQLAQWVDATTIQGLNIFALTLAQGQITGLITALANKASKVHNLVDAANHPVTGLTPGHFLKALTPTTYGFVVHGLTKIDIGLTNVTDNAQVKKISASTNLAIARWDGSAGDLLRNSLATIADDGSINIPTGATYKVNGIPIVVGGGGGGGIVPTNNILYWEGASNFYTPYSAAADGVFYIGTTDPTNTTRLNYGGYLFATRHYGDLYKLDGSLQHLTVAAGNASGAAGTDAGNLILRAGNALSEDNISQHGFVYIVPGNGYNSSISGTIYLGDSAYISQVMYLAVAGVSADISLAIIPKGVGTLVLGSVGAQTSVPGTFHSVGNISAENDFVFQGLRTSTITGTNGSVGVLDGYDLIVKGGSGVTTGNGANLYLYAGVGAGGGSNGNIFIGTGSAGTYPLVGSGTGTSVLLYNRTTGQVTYGDMSAGGGGGDIYTDHIYEITAGHGVDIDTFKLKDGTRITSSLGANYYIDFTSLGYTFAFTGSGSTLQFGSQSSYLGFALGGTYSKGFLFNGNVSLYSSNIYTMQDTVSAVGLDCTIRGGDATTPGVSNYNGGNLLLYGGNPANTGVTGKIFLGTGSAGTNPLAGSGTGTSILLYNRATGEITFGDK